MAKLSSHLLANHKATPQWSGRSISPLPSICLNQHRNYGLSQFQTYVRYQQILWQNDKRSSMIFFSEFSEHHKGIF